MKSKSNISLVAFLFLWYIIPSFVMVFFSQSSLSSGLILVAFGLFLRKSAFYVIRPRYVLAVLAIGFFVQITTIVNPSYKSCLSLLIIMFMIMSLFGCITDFTRRNTCHSISFFYWLYVFFIIIGVLGVFRILEFGPYQGKAYPVFPFSEHSHFALAFAPISIYLQLLISSKLKKLMIALIPLIFGLTFPSLVFLVLAIVQLFLIGRKINGVILIGLFILGVIVIFYPGTNIEYFQDRILFDPQNPNLSNLVYLQGWESAYMALKETYLVGLGFQNNGNQSIGWTTEIIQQIHGDNLNRLDGGFLASKIISEFGILGIILVLIFLISSVILWHNSYKKLFNNSSEFNALFYALTFSLFIEVFFRGYGYFSPTFILYISMLIYLLSNRLDWVKCSHA